jgi:tetratricopeptide (TPR) repeat protein
MGIRKVVLISVLTLTTCLARAQIKTYVEADSVSNALYKSGDWKELIKISNDALKDQLDFVSLRSRLGYAYFVTGNYSEALIQYQQVFYLAMPVVP